MREWHTLYIIRLKERVEDTRNINILATILSPLLHPLTVCCVAIAVNILRQAWIVILIVWVEPLLERFSTLVMDVKRVVVTHQLITKRSHTHKHSRNNSCLSVNILRLFEDLLVVVVHARCNLSLLLLTLKRELTTTTIGIHL